MTAEIPTGYTTKGLDDAFRTDLELELTRMCDNLNAPIQILRGSKLGKAGAKLTLCVGESAYFIGRFRLPLKAADWQRLLELCVTKLVELGAMSQEQVRKLAQAAVRQPAPAPAPVSNVPSAPVSAGPLPGAPPLNPASRAILDKSATNVVQKRVEQRTLVNEAKAVLAKLCSLHNADGLSFSLKSNQIELHFTDKRVL